MTSICAQHILAELLVGESDYSAWPARGPSLSRGASPRMMGNFEGGTFLPQHTESPKHLSWLKCFTGKLSRTRTDPADLPFTAEGTVWGPDGVSIAHDYPYSKTQT